MFQLVDEKRNRVYPLNGFMKEIGRLAECDIHLLDDARVSRRHARLDWDGSGWVVVDAGSTNGLFVNGKRVEEHRLKPGDELEVGETTLRYLALDKSDPFAHKKITEVGVPREEDESRRGNSWTGDTWGKKRKKKAAGRNLTLPLFPRGAKEKEKETPEASSPLIK